MLVLKPLTQNCSDKIRYLHMSEVLGTQKQEILPTVLTVMAVCIVVTDFVTICSLRLQQVAATIFKPAH